jgi:hypothetical protein
MGILGIFSIIFFVLLLYTIFTPEREPPYVFWTNDIVNEIGIVNNNKLLFYTKTETDSLKKIIGKDFELPKEFVDVIGYDFNNIGVIADSKVRFYQYDESIWKSDNKKDFILPEKYKGVFSISRNSKAMGLIIDGFVQFYFYENTWETNYEFINNFKLPDDFVAVFYLPNTNITLGVITDKKIMFFKYENHEWLSLPERDYELNIITTTTFSGKKEKYEIDYKIGKIIGIARDNFGITETRIKTPGSTEFVSYLYTQFGWVRSRNDRIDIYAELK